MAVAVRALAIVGVLLWAATADAANRYVCAAGTGCDAGSPHGAGTSYATIAAALAAAGSGDTIFIVPAVYNESVTLPNKGALGIPITIRSSKADTLFPPDGVRLCPDVRADGSTLQCSPNVAVADLPTIVGTDTSTNSRSFQTAVGAQDYIIKFVRVISNTTTLGFNEMIQLGSNDATQSLFTDQPRDITVDRVLFEANHLIGQKLGVSFNGANITVQNSYFANLLGFGQDAACGSGYNGTGPVYLLNNYCEGGGYGFFFGGADPQMRTTVNTAAGSTTTVLNYDAATFSAGDSETAHSLGAMADLVGKTIAIAISATVREHREVTAADATANTITVTPALSSAPAAGLPIDWGAVFIGGNMERNWFFNPTKWQNAIIQAPTNVAASPSNAAGTLAAGTYYYIVAARNHDSYQGNDITSPNSQQVSCTLDATGQCVITWSAVTGATHYRVFGRSSGGQTIYFQVTAPTVTFTDTGGAGTAGTPPGTTGSRWTLKNHIEVKQVRDFFVRYNRLTNKSFGQGGSGAGVPIWIKSVNQGGNSPFAQTKNLTVSYNMIEHASGCFLITSQEEYLAGTYARPAPLEDVVIEHNLCVDTGSQYGGNSYAFSTGYTQGKNITIRNNTILHSSRGLWAPDGAAVQGTFTFSDNLAYHNTYGFLGPGVSVGVPTLDIFMPTRVFLNNVLAGASTSPYPATTIKPTTTDFQAAFVNPTGSTITNYDLVAGHSWRTASSTGGRIGADIPTLSGLLAGVQAGSASGAPAWVTGSPLPSGAVGVAYTTTVVAAGGTGGKTYTLIGSLPSGLTLATSTGIISGSPTGAGTSNFTVRATDQAAAFTDRGFSISIVAAGGAVTVTTTSVPNADANTAYSVPLNATGGTGTFVWTLAGGSLPPGFVLGTATGLIAGTATTPGKYDFTVRVDSGANFDTQDLSIRVSNVGPAGPIPDIPRPNVWNGQAIWTHATDTTPTVEGQRVKPKDIWVDPTNTPYIVTATSPTVQVSGIGAHLLIPFSVIGVSATISENAILDTPAGGKEYGDAGMRIPADLTRGYSQFRLSAFVTNATATGGAVLRVEYSADCSTGWAQLAETAGTGTVATTAVSTTTVRSAFVNILPAAKADICLRVWHTTGDGVDDIAVRLLMVEIK